MIALRVNGATGDLVWVEHYDGGFNLNDRAADVAVRDDGQIVITGVGVNPDENASYQTYLLDAADGHALWEQRQPGAVNNENLAGWLGLTAGGDAIVANRTWFSGHSFDVILQRYDAADGHVVWSQQYDRAGGSDDLRGMILDDEGQPVVVGVSSGDMMTLRFDAADGALLWSAFRDGPMGWFDLANCVIQGPDELIITGGFTDGGSSTWDATVVAYDMHSGAEEWMLIWDGVDGLTDELKAMALAGSSDLYAAGYSYNTSTDMDLVALRYEFPATAAPGVWNGRRELAAWPNPFRDSARLSLSLPAPGNYRAEIFDTQGRLVRVLAAGQAPAGDLPLVWNGRDDAGNSTPAGLYLIRVRGDAGEYRGRLLRLQ